MLVVLVQQVLVTLLNSLVPRLMYLLELQQLLFQSATHIDLLSYLFRYEGTNNNLSEVEMNLVHDGTDVYLLEYGNIETSSGLGTFSISISVVH